MTELNKDFGNALNEERPFDQARAADLRHKVIASFNKQMKTVERYLLASLCLCAWALLFCIFKYYGSADVKWQIGYAIIILAVLENSILMKLWYWVVNNKMNVLKEIKLLRLQMASPSDQAVMPTEEQLFAPQRKTRMGVSKLEGWIWWLILIGGVIVISWIMAFYFPRRDQTMVSTEKITLEASGAGTQRVMWASTNRSIYPLRDYPMYSGGKAEDEEPTYLEETHFFDEFGRKLPAKVYPAGENRKYLVRLIDPVEPGKRVQIGWTHPVFSTRTDDVWTFTMGPMWSSGKKQYHSTITLPPGAEIVSVEPKPVSVEPSPAGQSNSGAAPVIKFEAKLGPNEKWQYKIQYRLPVNTPGQP